jgi:hypothetical protein
VDDIFVIETRAAGAGRQVRALVGAWRHRTDRPVEPSAGPLCGARRFLECSHPNTEICTMTQRRNVLWLSLAGLLAAPLATLPGPAQAQAPAATQAAVPSLIGSWTVDLRPTPGSPAYLKKLVITAQKGTGIEGHFYDGSPLQAGRINTTSGPTLAFAFFTDPGEGAYQSAGRHVSANRLEGMTLSTTRGFLLTWTAVRDTE